MHLDRPRLQRQPYLSEDALRLRQPQPSCDFGRHKAVRNGDDHAAREDDTQVRNDCVLVHGHVDGDRIAEVKAGSDQRVRYATARASTSLEFPPTLGYSL